MKQFKSTLLLLPLTSFLFFCSPSESNKGDDHFKKGEYDKAEKFYSETLKLSPKDVRMLYNRGRAREEQGDIKLAIEDYENALLLDQNNFLVLLSLANLHFDQKNFNNSLIYSSKAVEIPGAPAMASFLKARALQQTGLLEDAIKAYGHAIKLDKEFGQAYLNRGFLKLAMKKNKGACEDFKLASLLEYSGAAEALKSHCK